MEVIREFFDRGRETTTSRTRNPIMIDNGRVESRAFVPDRPDNAQEGAIVSTEIVEPKATAALSAQPLAESTNDLQGPTVLFDSRISCDALAFCRLHGIDSELGLAIETARNCFPIVGNPNVELVHDPETEDASYLVIEIPVRGEVTDIVRAHRNFASETAKSLGPKRAMITLNYDII
jgi:hypothetical protein